MEKFWEWMKKKGRYDRNIDLCNLKCGEVGVLSETMLIGYMIEYLMNYKYIDIKIPYGKSNYFKNIQELYDDLKLKIEQVGE